MNGYIDSIETMGLVDGPGIRMVIFMKGCRLRCLFCHNPETWTMKDSTIITSDEVIKRLENNMSYYKNGGVTFSGGEPLLQPKFLIDCLKKSKKLGIHTALDTSGVGSGMYDEILDYTDLVLLDIKAYKEDEYKKMTGLNMDEFNKFITVLKKKNKALWIRQVVIPGINDTKEYMLGLKEYLRQFNNIEKIELLPYHLYGVDKYKKIGIKYPLDGVPPMEQSRIKDLYEILVNDMC